MRSEFWMKFVLGLSGATLGLVGALLLFQPVAFLASSGVALPDAPGLLSELRAPGAALFGLGVFVIAAIGRRGWHMAALVASAGVFTTYGTARLFSMVVDGLPDASLIAATGIELVLGAVCIASIIRRRSLA